MTVVVSQSDWVALAIGATSLMVAVAVFLAGSHR